MSYQYVGTQLRTEPAHLGAYTQNPSLSSIGQRKFCLQVLLVATIATSLVVLVVSPPWETGHDSLPPLGKGDEANRSRHETQEAVPVRVSSSTIPRTNSSLSTAVTTTPVTFVDPSKLPSLYCIVMLLPFGSGPELLQAQLEQRQSAFACDETVVYSSVSHLPGISFPVTAVKLDLSSGGYSDARAYLQVMKAVIDSGHYLNHDWTAKVDPDVVFLPGRLKGLLFHMFHARVKEPGNVFLTSCKDADDQGALQVMSKQALETFGLGQEQMCGDSYRAATGSGDRPTHTADDDSNFSSAVFLQKCLLTLDARQVDAFSSLISPGCSNSSTPGQCSASVVAVGSFTDKADYASCFFNATEFGQWTYPLPKIA